MDVLAFLTGLTSAVSLFKAAVETRDEEKIRTATNELQVQLTHFGSEVIAMQKDSVQATERERALLRTNDELSEKIRDLERRRAERERYELVEPYSGTIVLRVKESARAGEPSHYLCPGCLDNRAVKSILQFRSSDKRAADCPECKHMYRFADGRPSEMARGSDGGFYG